MDIRSSEDSSCVRLASPIYVGLENIQHITQSSEDHWAIVPLDVSIHLQGSLHEIEFKESRDGGGGVPQ